MSDTAEAARALARYELWRRGDLYFKLHETQRRIYDRIRGSKANRHFICCSRRLGKSFLLVCLAFETALRKANARILYLAPFGQDAQKIFQDIADFVLPDCPPNFKPEFRTQDREFRFPNGSTIRFKGVNGERAEQLRGGSADLAILDECGSMDNLDEVVTAVVDPMTATTNGLVIMATTPAVTPGHESKKFCDAAFADGVGYEFNLLDAPHIDYATKLRLLRGCGETEEHARLVLAGKAEPKTTKARREYWCKWVTESGQAIVPEFDADAKAEIVRATELPEFYDAYVSMDPGHTDNTGILFAHFDAKNHKLVVEDEWLERHAGTDEIANAIKSREKERWGETKPYMRVSDVELRLIQDLTTKHGLPFIPTLKKDSKGAVWNMRQLVKNRTIVIHPRCVNLLRQLENATWNRKGTDFSDEIYHEDEEKLIAHYDLVAALKYLCRMAQLQRNPYPEWHVERHRKSVSRRREGRGPSIRVDTPAARRLEDREGSKRR